MGLNIKCECADPLCPVCEGDCWNTARVSLFRVDMDDEWGTPMCRACADDALASGVFTEGRLGVKAGPFLFF